MCPYSFVDPDHMFGPFDMRCHGGVLYNHGPDGAVDETDQPCPRCNTRAVITRLLASIRNIESISDTLFPHHSAQHWNESLRTPLLENPGAALTALQAIGPLVFQDCTHLIPKRRITARLWPWPIDGVSAHTQMPLMGLSHPPKDTPLMPQPYTPGDTGQAYCPTCQNIGPTTFGTHDIPLSDGSGVVPAILAATCDRCGAVVAIPAQSTPAIKAFHEAAQQDSGHPKKP